MSTASQTFRVVRRGHRAEEYEDASAADDAAGRYAVADGATESCFAGLWARLLAEGFVENREGEGEKGRGGEERITVSSSISPSPPLPLSPSLKCALNPDPWFPSLAALQEQWRTAISGRQLSWYSEPAIERGAFATFLGLMIWEEKGGPVSPSSRLPVSPSPPYRWAAMAVGDACLFHTRGDELLRAFPLERAEQFDNVPKLIGSRMSAQALRDRCRQWTDGAGLAGDRLWMMTDALAQWCLAEAGAWSALSALVTASEPAGRFASWIEALRDSGRLKNDDVTLLAISLKEPGETKDDA